MKKLILLGVALCAALTACQSPIGPALTQTMVTEAVTFGVQQDTNTVPYLRACKDVICGLSAQSVVDPAAIVAALESSSAKELKTPEGKLILNGALAIYETVYYYYGADVTASKVEPYLVALCNGLTAGLPDTSALHLQKKMGWPAIK